jgi:spermidine/putrescine transport system substrate-binding protein
MIGQPRSNQRSAFVIGVLSASLVVAAAGATVAQDPQSSLDPGADLSTQKLVISNWAAYMPDELPAQFEAEFGTPVTVTNHATNEEIVAKLTAGGDSGIDVAFVSGQFAQALAEQGLLEPIHHDLVPNLANLYPEANELAYDPGNVYSVPYSWGTTGLCYRDDLVATAPDSWYDLLTPDPDVTGKTTALATERWLMLPAQKALGYSANTTDPTEMDAVKQLLIEAKKTLLAYDDTTFYSRLVSGEASLVEAWDGWCNYAIADPTVGSHVKFVVPKEGSDLWADTMVVLKTSKNKEAAHALIDYILRPEIHSWVANNILYKVPNKAAMEALDPAMLTSYPNMAMTPTELLTGESLVDLGEAGPMYTEIATEIAAQ